jgi:Cu/Ag efflux protein CusF
MFVGTIKSVDLTAKKITVAGQMITRAALQTGDRVSIG